MPPYRTFVDRLNELRRNLRIFETLNDKVSQAVGPGGSRSLKDLTVSSSYILASAALEEYVRMTLAELRDRISAESPQACTLRLSLLALCSASQFRSLATLANHHKLWSGRVDIMESLLSSSEAVFAEDASPLDKKTLTATHFETVWRVFGFSPPHLPAEVGRYGAVLRDLRQHRNNIAHGHQSFDELAAVKSISDAKHMLNMVQDIGAHLEGETSTYISEGRYLR